MPSTKKLPGYFSAAARRGRVAALAALSLSFAACHHPGKRKEGRAEEHVTRAAPRPPQAGRAPHEDAYHLCLHGCPAGAPAEDRVIERPVYVLSNNPRTKFADWVAYAVSRETIGPTKKRVWHADPDLPPGETLSPQDYRGIDAVLHMDRGHQAPLASLTGSRFWEMADDLSNITPQKKNLNEGAWEALERAERALAAEGVTVHAVTGPLYEREMPRLPHARLPHVIPSGYWKAVAVEEGGTIAAAAFIMDQDLPRGAAFCATAVTVRAVEARAHLDLEPGLGRAEQERVETARGALLARLGC